MSTTEQLPAAVAQPNMPDLIRFAIESENVDAQKLHLLLDAQERIMLQKREAAFNQDYAAMMPKIPRILKAGSVGYKEKKNDPNSQTVEAFKFARYEDIEKVVKPIMQQHGFAVTFTTEERNGGGCIIHATLMHKEGHCKNASLPLPLDTGGGKNNIQAMGSTISYGRRYALCMLLDIVTVGEDDDGNGGTGPTISDEQAAALEKRITELGADRAAFFTFFSVEDLKQLPVRDLKKAELLLNQKAKKKQNAGA